MPRIRITTLTDKMKDEQVLSKLKTIGAKTKDKEKAGVVETHEEAKEKVSARCPPRASGISMSGPGTIPWMRKAPMRMAISTLAGTPKATVVIKLPPMAELFAAPGPRTPSTAPFPKRSFSFELCKA